MMRALAAMLFAVSIASAVARPLATPAPKTRVPQILYGASYYNEYMPAELGASRLNTDVALMKRAGITVVRLGESSWGSFEPADGRFEFAWTDRVIAALSQATA